METLDNDEIDTFNVGNTVVPHPMNSQRDLAADEHPDEGHLSEPAACDEPAQSACRDRCPELTYCSDPDSRAKVTTLNCWHLD